MFNLFKKKVPATKSITSSDYLVCNILIHNVPHEAKKRRFIYYKKGSGTYSNEFVYATDTLDSKYVPQGMGCVSNINWRYYLWGLDKA